MRFSYNFVDKFFVTEKEVTMKFELFGFSQARAIEYGLDIKDLLIIDYVWDMIASPTMQHILKNDVAYVWLMHDRILNDLPILGISKRSLIDYLNKLKDLGILDVVTIHNDNLRGSKSFYGLTEKCERLRYDQVQKIAVSQRPSAENCSSDNIRDDIYNTKTEGISNTNIQNKLIEDNEDANYNIEKKKSEKIKWFVENYNSICKSLPKCTRLTDKRRKDIKKIMDKFSEEEILQVFTNLEASDFCKGNNDRGWKANFDFVLREDKFVNALEGRYNGSSRRGCNVETISAGVHKGISKEEKEELRRLVERGELEEY
jgi:hypothetical protein